MKPNSTLILVCDANKLKAQGFTITSDISFIKRFLPPECPIEAIEATSKQDLTLALAGALARLKTTYKKFNIIVVIGHGNKKGLQLTPDLNLVSWEAVARWVEPFEPRYIILVACEGGRWLPCAALFRGIQSLKEIYGSPVKVTKEQVNFYAFLVLYLMFNPKIPKDIMQGIQGFILLLTKGVIFHQTRREFMHTGQYKEIIWRGIEEILKQFQERV